MRNYFERFSLQDRGTFERAMFGAVALGAVSGLGAWMLELVVRRAAFNSMLTGWSLLALAFMGVFRSGDRMLSFGWRVALGLPVLLLAMFVNMYFAAVLGCVLAGAAWAEPSWSKAAVGGLAGALGAAWAVAVVPPLMSGLHGAVPSLFVALFAGAATGLLAAVPWLALHARYFELPLEQRLVSHPLLGEKAARAFHRCYAVFPRLPNGPARSAIFMVVDETAVKALAQAEQVQRATAQLGQVSVERMQTDLAALKEEISQSSDAQTRQRLESAAIALSDTLEQLSSVHTANQRVRAELQVSLSELERAAVAIEAASGDAVALELVASRLARRAPPLALAAA